MEPRETSGDHDGRVAFRLTCRRHRATFIEILKREGVSDEAEIERLRRGFAALVMKTYPGGYLHHIAEANCMGCAFEESGPQCWAWAVEALVALIHGMPPRKAFGSPRTPEWQAPLRNRALSFVSEAATPETRCLIGQELSYSRRCCLQHALAAW